MNNNDPFATTHWGLVVAARDAASGIAREAFGELFRTYAKPLNQYVLRRGYSREDADDLVQEFFSTFLEKEYLQSVSAEKGKFRAFLLAALKHFLSDEHDKRKARKRGGQFQFVSLSAPGLAEAAGVSPGDDPERAFHRAWALAVLETALRRVECQYGQEGKAMMFGLLKPRLAGDGSQSFEQLGVALGMQAGAVRTAAFRLRRRYKTALMGVIAETVGNTESVEEELAFLRRALGQA